MHPPPTTVEMAGRRRRASDSRLVEVRARWLGSGIQTR